MENPPEPKRPISEVSFKELMQDLVETVTDLEKKFFRTFWDLTVRPKLVIETYLREGKKTYISAFRYLVMSIFLGLLTYTFFYQPGTIDGPLYGELKQGIEFGLSSEIKDFGESTLLNEDLFNEYYLEAQSQLIKILKILSFLNVPAVLLSLLLYFRKLRYNFTSLIVISIFIGAHANLLGSLIQIPFWLLLSTVATENSKFLSFGAHGVEFFYFLYVFFTLCRGQIRFVFLRSFFAALFSSALNLLFNFIIAGSVFFYVMTYTPVFLYRKYEDPKTISQIQEGTESHNDEDGTVSPPVHENPQAAPSAE